jgi:hypothetical protein
MLATQPRAAIGNTNSDTTTTSKPEPEILIKDVTMEILGESRAEWRRGFDAGLRSGAQRVLESQCMGQIVTELILLREVAAKLGEKCDYWTRRAEEMELEATHWHEVASGTQA